MRFLSKAADNRNTNHFLDEVLLKQEIVFA